MKSWWGSWQHRYNEKCCFKILGERKKKKREKQEKKKIGRDDEREINVITEPTRIRSAQLQRNWLLGDCVADQIKIYELYEFVNERAMVLSWLNRPDMHDDE